MNDTSSITFPSNMTLNLASPLPVNRHPGFTPAPTPTLGYSSSMATNRFNFAIPALPSVPSSSSAQKHHKRERDNIMGEDEIDMSYSKNKRMVHDGFRSLSLSTEPALARLTNTPVPQGDLFAEDYPLQHDNVISGECIIIFGLQLLIFRV